jgi:hypothetical protein
MVLKVPVRGTGKHGFPTPDGTPLSLPPTKKYLKRQAPSPDPTPIPLQAGDIESLRSAVREGVRAGSRRVKVVVEGSRTHPPASSPTAVMQFVASLILLILSQWGLGMATPSACPPCPSVNTSCPACNVTCPVNVTTVVVPDSTTALLGRVAGAYAPALPYLASPISTLLLRAVGWQKVVP